MFGHGQGDTSSQTCFMSPLVSTRFPANYLGGGASGIDSGVISESETRYMEGVFGDLKGSVWEVMMISFGG